MWDFVMLLVELCEVLHGTRFRWKNCCSDGSLAWDPKVVGHWWQSSNGYGRSGVQIVIWSSGSNSEIHWIGVGDWNLGHSFGVCPNSCFIGSLGILRLSLDFYTQILWDQKNSCHGEILHLWSTPNSWHSYHKQCKINLWILNHLKQGHISLSNFILKVCIGIIQAVIFQVGGLESCVT